jgi:SH3 domain-containing YSC84-like protein 1
VVLVVFLKKVSIGAELAVTAGPVGAGAMLDTGIEVSPVFSYTKSKVVYL